MTGIYIHIPFCIKKCAYCDFISLEKTDLSDEYLSALQKEIELTAVSCSSAINTIYIGGGTPSLLTSSQMRNLFSVLYKNFNICKEAEITVECNPCSVTKEKFLAYKEIGVNRLSIGLQAAQDRLLQLLSRSHNLNLFEQAFKNARDAGFDNISIDAMYALPTQSNADFEHTLNYITDLSPEHISAYALHVSEGTPLFKRIENNELQLIDEDEDANMYVFAQDFLEKKGYLNYEISNFAKPDKESTHNLLYWNLNNYYGFGLSAHSCVNNVRYYNFSDMNAYIEKLNEETLPIQGKENISQNERKKEYLMLKMRLKSGIVTKEYYEAFDEDFEEIFHNAITQLTKYGLATFEQGRLSPTKKGFCLQNQLVHVLHNEC